MGYALLAYYLASEDKGLCAHVVDKMSRLVETQNLSAERLASAILPYMLLGPFPSMRWTRNLRELAAMSATHAGFVRDVLAGLMRFEPGQAPRDIGGMIELLYQLQIEAAAPFADVPAIFCLERLEGGGNAVRYSKKLLALKAA